MKAVQGTCVALILSTLFFAAAACGDPEAGFMTSEATLSVGTVPLTVWYPTFYQVRGPSEYVIPEYQLLDIPSLRPPQSRWQNFRRIIT